MRILGIDPGSRFTGFGFIEVRGDNSACVAHGVIKTQINTRKQSEEKDAPQDFPQRLGVIFSELSHLIEQHQPDQVAIESVFVSRNPGSALKLGQARGAAICAAIAQGLTVAEYSPRSVKQAIVGRGAADKLQVQHMVKILLRLTEDLAEDAADALAVALCHQHTQQTVQRMQQRSQVTGGRS